MRNFAAFLVICLSLVLSFTAFAVETGRLIIDWEALEKGRIGVAAKIEVTDQALPISDSEIESFRLHIGEYELIPVNNTRYGDIVVISFFARTKSWPNPQAPQTLTAELYKNSKRISRLKNISQSRGLKVYGQSLLAPVAKSGETLEQRLRSYYHAATTQLQRRRFLWIATASEVGLADSWRDLGHVAYRRKLYREAAWFFHKAAQADQQDVLGASWLARAVLQFAPDEKAMLGQINTLLSNRMAQLYRQADAGSASFGSVQKRITRQADQLSAEFATIQEQLRTLSVASRNSQQARDLSQRLTAINREIDGLNTVLSDKYGDVYWVTPFMVAALVDTQISLSRIDDELVWLEQAQKTSEAAFKRNFSPLPVDRSLRARVFLRRAAYNHQKGMLAEIKFRSDPNLKRRTQLKAQYEKDKLSLGVLKDKIDADTQAIDDDPDIKRLKQERNQARKNFEKMRAQAQEKARPLEDISRKIDQLRSENKTSEANKLVEKYNALLPDVRDISAQANIAAERANGAEQKYIEAYNTKSAKLFKPYEIAQNKFNDLVGEINKLNELLRDKEDVYKDLIFNRDQFLALARDDLYRGMGKTPSREMRNLLLAADNIIEIGETDEQFYTSRPWCTSISYNCSACFGLAVLGCEFAQMDAISACQAGESVLPYSERALDGGGIIGACRGVQPLQINKRRWLAPETSNSTQQISPEDEEERELAAQVFDDSLGPLFEEACSTEPVIDLSQPEDGGLILQFSQETLDNIKKAREKWRKDKEREFMLAEMEHRLGLIRNNQKLFADPEIKRFVEQLGDQPERFQDPVVQRALAEKIAERAEHIIKSSIAEAGTKDDWVAKAHEINNLAKEANKIVSDLGGSLPRLDKLTGYADNALDIIDGGRAGDGNKIMSGVRGLTAGVPGPLTAVLEVPGRMIGGHVTHMSDTLKQEAAVMGTVAELIGSGGTDPETREKLRRQVEAVQNNLTPKSFVKQMLVKPMKDFFKDKVPGGETILNLFSRASESLKGRKTTGGRCLNPPLTISDD